MLIDMVNITSKTEMQNMVKFQNKLPYERG